MSVYREYDDTVMKGNDSHIGQSAASWCRVLKIQDVDVMVLVVVHHLLRNLLWQVV